MSRATHLAHPEFPGEDIHAFLRIAPGRNEEVHDDDFPFRESVDRHVADVEKEDRSEPVARERADDRRFSRGKSRGAGGGEHQPGERRSVAEERHLHAAKIGDALNEGWCVVVVQLASRV
jgi:hypothetical protein